MKASEFVASIYILRESTEKYGFLESCEMMCHSEDTQGPFLQWGCAFPWVVNCVGPLGDAKWGQGCALVLR